MNEEEMILQFCDEYKLFVNNDPNMEYTGGCHTMANSMEADNFDNVCRYLDQCIQYPEVLFPVENNVNGINMTKFLENQQES